MMKMNNPPSIVDMIDLQQQQGTITSTTVFSSSTTTTTTTTTTTITAILLLLSLCQVLLSRWMHGTITIGDRRRRVQWKERSNEYH